MKILMIHNYYRRRGGEDAVFEQEAELLRGAGHEVRRYTRHNDALAARGAPRGPVLARTALFNRTTVADIRTLLAAWIPDVAHMHNIHPLISPSIYSVLGRHGVRSVQSIHNYRWFCIGATFFRAGHVCEDCIRKRGGRFHGLWHRCYRHSLGASAVLTLTQQRNAHPRKRFGQSIQRILVQSDFVRDLFLERGFPARQLAVHSNFMALSPSATPGPRTGPIVFAGRLEPSKGVEVLLQAAALLPQVRFEILGSGPARPMLEALAARLGVRRVHFHGALPTAACRARIGSASAVVLPSLWYESFPMVVLEGFSQETPVVASRLGSLSHIVRDGLNGLSFTPGSAAELAHKLRELLQSPTLARALTERALADLRTRYSPEAARLRLESIYRSVCAEPLSAAATRRR